MTLAAGSRLGPYEVLSLLGAGGMGEVYRARDTKLNREVALKVLPDSFASDHERLARFHREAQILASLNHSNIAHVHGFEDSQGVGAIVMELVEGPTLGDRISRGPIPFAETLPIARQIADALEAAHDKGITHRDLKPANIKVREDGTAKVLDFGLAAVSQAAVLDPIADSNTPTAVTQNGVIMGTAAYMSPEQARGKTVDKRTDIWAFGVVLFEMLSGRRLFAAETSSDIVAAILSRQPDWSLLPPETPGAVRSLLQRCLEKDPHQRLRDIGEARVALSDSTLLLTHPAASTAGPATSRRFSTVWAVLLAGLLLGVLALVAAQRFFAPTGARLPASGEGPPRLFVFPFQNLSRQASDEWLAGALADSLTLGLRDVENIVLVNRDQLIEMNQSRNPELERVAKSLGARFYVSGSYQRVGDDLKVVARMVDTHTGTITLQESLTDRFDSLLRIEDELARRFATTLERTPTAARKVQTASLSAYESVARANDLYLDGRFSDAVQQLEHATTLDGNYADAWALLGKSYAQLSAPNNVDRGARTEILAKALSASQKAIALNPNLYEAQLALATTYQLQEEVESWRIAAQKAIDLNDRLAEGYVLLGDSYGASPGFGCSRKRDADLAERSYRKALQLNPSFGAAHARLITTLFWSGRVEDALRQSDEALKLLPGNISIQRVRAVSLAWLGRADELEQQAQKIATLVDHPNVLDKWLLAVISLLRGSAAVAAPGFQEAIAGGPVIVREIDTGRIYAQSGRMKESVDHLRRAFALDSSCAVFVSESRAFETYRKDPALQTLLAERRRSIRQ